MTERYGPKIWLLVAALVALYLLVAATEVRADTLDVPVDTVYRGDPGDLIHVATIPATPGVECTAVLEGRNNESVHPDSDILVASIVFADVEDGAFSSAGLGFTATGPIPVAVRLGGDGVFSAGFLLEVTCNPPTTTTTAPEPSETTTTTDGPTTSTPPATTTTSPPPEGGVPAGGGSEADRSISSWVLIPLGVATVLFAGMVTFAAWMSDKRRDR